MGIPRSKEINNKSNKNFRERVREAKGGRREADVKGMVDGKLCNRNRPNNVSFVLCDDDEEEENK